jgi:type IV pilus assembly protein PilV
MMDNKSMRQEGKQQMDLNSNIRQYSRGFTLLEAMIALVIFSVALLGLARMYTQMMSMSHSAYFRTLATIQANDLEERIRANPNGDYEGNCPDDPDAAADFSDWCGNTATLFGGLLQSATVTVSGEDYTIALEWRERVQDEAIDDLEGENVTFRYVVRR